MTQAITRPRSFQDLLNYDDGTDNIYELTEGELIEVAPESEINAFIAECLKATLDQFFGRRLVKIQEIYIEVAPLPKMPLNRDPDLVVLHPNHPKLMAASESGKMAIANDMPPPQLIVEVVSRYKDGRDPNFARDYGDKLQQYAIRGVPEYWIIDPKKASIEVNWDPNQTLRRYDMFATFKEMDMVRSHLPQLANLQLTAQQILEPEGGQGNV